MLDKNGNIKLADFGLSNTWHHNCFLHTFCGSPLYASPEIVNGRPYYGPEVRTRSSMQLVSAAVGSMLGNNSAIMNFFLCYDVSAKCLFTSTAVATTQTPQTPSAISAYNIIVCEESIFSIVHITMLRYFVSHCWLQYLYATQKALCVCKQCYSNTSLPHSLIKHLFHSYA